MHKHNIGRAISSIAILAVSLGVVVFAVRSNGWLAPSSLLPHAQAAGSSIALSSAGSDNGVDQAIGQTASGTRTMNTLAVAKKHVRARMSATTIRRSKPKPVPPTPTPVPTNASVTRSVEVTFYGSYDNDPAGSLAISNPVIHQQAGGVGSYADPLTFASPVGTGAYPVGTRIYVPFLQKYFIREDTCGVSWTATSGCGAVSHVDLYMGNPSNMSAVLQCENVLTPDSNATIVVNPASNLPYDATPLWNATTGACAKTH